MSEISTPNNSNQNSEDQEELLLTADDIPPQTKTSFVRLLIFSFIFAAMAIIVFLLYLEFRKPAVTDSFNIQSRPVPADYKDYNNDFWGIRFKYPGTWSPAIGSFDDGLYYFASEPINFINEISGDGAIVALKTYNNYKKMPFNDWALYQEQNYFPAGQVEKTEAKFQDLPAIHYHITLKNPSHNIGSWDMWMVSRTPASKYELILETPNQKVHQDFLNSFENILDSVSFYSGYGTEENK